MVRPEIRLAIHLADTAQQLLLIVGRILVA